MPQRSLSYRATLRRCARSIAPHRRLFAGVVGATAVGSLLSAVGDPLFQKALIDSLARRDLKGFALVGGLALALYTVLRLSNYVAGVLAQRLKNGVCEDMTLRMFDGFFRIPFSHVSRNERGYFVSRIYDEPAAATSLVDFGVQLLAAVVVFAG
ncbi:MAG TPA: hypothetical protein VEQ60_17190, partial [Longimicrobium sp.]|nr:hypothetical protein [Longimicrobium sp.]